MSQQRFASTGMLRKTKHVRAQSGKHQKSGKQILNVWWKRVKADTSVSVGSASHFNMFVSFLEEMNTFQSKSQILD